MCFSSGSEKHVWKIAFIDSNQPYFAWWFMWILRCKNNKILPKFLYEVLNNEAVRNIVRWKSSWANIKNLSNSISEIKIPLPPINIQKKVIEECSKIDEEYNTSRMTIEEYKKKISDIFTKLEIVKGGGD